MMTRSSWLAFVVTVAACGSGGARPHGTLGNSGGGGGGGTTLADALAIEVGGGVPVAIVPYAGLRAISADGARQRVLVPAPVPWALVDNRAGVVWFGTDDPTVIRALDLASPAAAPLITTVVTNLPTETDAGTPLVTIRYPEPSVDVPTVDEISVGHPISPHVVVSVAAEPSLHGEGGILDMWDQHAEYEAQVQQATIVAAPYLAQLAARGAGRWLSAPRDGKEHRVQLADLSACDEPDACGQAEDVTPTLWRVVTSFSCGDGCYTGWQLYDPAKQALLEDDWARRIGDAWLAPDGSAFVSAGQVIRFDSGPLAATPATEDDNGMGGGWLGGGTYLP